MVQLAEVIAAASPAESQRLLDEAEAMASEVGLLPVVAACARHRRGDPAGMRGTG
jgi:hypothetical protein